MNILFWRKNGKSPRQILKENIDAEFEATRGVVAPGVMVEHAHPVKEAAATAVKKDGLVEEAAQRERVRLQRVYDSLLPVEEGSAHEIAQKLATLNGEVLDQRFPRIDLSFLKWRRKADGWPVFAVYSPDSSICKFHSNLSDWGSSDAGCYPEFIDKLTDGCYADVYRKMKATLRRTGRVWESMELYSKFKGVIPDAVRTKIKSVVDEKAFKHVVIVGEAAWENRIVDLDPLVVGIIGEQGWLIDSFDLTPVERIVKSEFAGSPVTDWEK